MARQKKAPCVDVALDVRSDIRFVVLGDIAGYNRQEALGRMFDLWAWCTERAIDRRKKKLPWQEPVAPDAVVRTFLGPKGVEAILGDGVDEFALGERVEGGGIYIRGTHRMAWEDELAATARSGGTVRAKTAPRDLAGKFVSTPTVIQQNVDAYPAIDPASTPATPASSPSPSPSPSPLPEHGGPGDPDLSDHRARSERARARAIPPVGVGVVPDYDRIERDRWCQGRWNLVNAHRARLANELGLEGVRAISDQDRGRVELAKLVRDGGDVARANVDHVIAVRVAEAEATRSVRWLAGSMFETDSPQWRNALAMTVDDARSARAGPRGVGPRGSPGQARSVFDVVDETVARITESRRKS